MWMVRTQWRDCRYVFTGFNYWRGVGEMLEDLGHRARSMLGIATGR